MTTRYANAPGFIQRIKSNLVGDISAMGSDAVQAKCDARYSAQGGNDFGRTYPSIDMPGVSLKVTPARPTKNPLSRVYRSLRSIGEYDMDRTR